MAKVPQFVLALVLTCALSPAQTVASLPGESLLDPKAPIAAGAWACPRAETQKLLIPRPFVQRAKLKARLLKLLYESLYDDTKGIVNAAREKEIKKLASKLKNE